MTTTNELKRANRVVVNKNENGTWVADFYKTHFLVGKLESTSEFKPKSKTATGEREEFRQFAIKNAKKIGVNWSPELQQQAWDRKYWKYETDAQVEEDAIELMSWTIKDLCEKRTDLRSKVKEITLDSIIPMESPLSYVEGGKYVKNGNWAVCQVNLEVTMETDGKETSIIYPIEMRSGQLTKIKLTKADIDGMIQDGIVEIA